MYCTSDPSSVSSRAQLDPLAKVQFEADKTDEGRDPPDDELEDPEQGGDTPPPTGLERTSPPPTPFSTDAARVVKHEGQETRAIRQRVEALEWDDGKRPVSVRMEDTEIEDARGPAAAPVVAVVEDQDAVIVDAAPLDAGEDAVVDNAEVKDVETAGVATPADMDVTDASGVAEVAAEVGETAQALAAAEEEDVHVAEVAAEVSISAAAVEATTEEINDSAQVALEVAPSAEIAAKEDEKAIEIEEGAPEKPSVPAMTPTKAATPSQNVRPPLTPRPQQFLTKLSLVTVILSIRLCIISIRCIPVHRLPFRICHRPHHRNSPRRGPEAQGQDQLYRFRPPLHLVPLLAPHPCSCVSNACPEHFLSPHSYRSLTRPLASSRLHLLRLDFDRPVHAVAQESDSSTGRYDLRRRIALRRLRSVEWFLHDACTSEWIRLRIVLERRCLSFRSLPVCRQAQERGGYRRT